MARGSSNDAELIARLIGNDETAVRYVFYEQYTDLLRLNAIKAAAGKPVVFEDLVQELYLYLSANNWEKLKRYDTSQPFVAWFSVVSYRFFKNFSRSMIDSATQMTISHLNDHPALTQGNGAISTIMMDIKNAIARLRPPRDRQILTALLLEEEDPATVADQFNVTVENLYNIKRRAILRLIQKHLKDYLD